MDESAFVFTSLCVLGWALVAPRLEASSITGPMVFVALGIAAGPDGLGLVELDSGRAAAIVNHVLEGALVLVLFTGAASLHASWRTETALPGRLIAIGLPLTIAGGWAVAALLLPGLDVWEAAAVGAILAPTDAALGEAVISNPRVPQRIRDTLDVESGLNDGISLPFLLVFIAAAERSPFHDTVLETFVRTIGIAVVVGAAVGFVGRRLVAAANRRRLTNAGWSGIAVLALAAIAYAGTDVLDGSGFIACFVAGLVYGTSGRTHLEQQIEASETLAAALGKVLVPISFLLVGAVVLGPALRHATWRILLTAVLALTVLRMVPVAIAMLGAGLRPATVAYLGWFGPRGLATIVFAALIVREADLPGTETIVSVAAITVTLSVYAHGLTANAGARRYAAWSERTRLADIHPG